MAMEASSIML